jgi:hypothetical protein
MTKRKTASLFPSILRTMRCCALTMLSLTPAGPAPPIPIRPSHSSIVSRPPAPQPRAVQVTVQTPQKKTPTYQAPLALPLIITVGVRMVCLYALPLHLQLLPIFRRPPLLLESETVLLSPHTFHFSLSVRHIQRLPRQCHLRGLRSRRPAHGHPRPPPAFLARPSTTPTPLRERHPAAYPSPP